MTPRFTVWFPILAAIGLAGVGGLTVQNQRTACADRVAGREDFRDVWLYLIADADPETERTIEFVDYFTDRYPPLECTWRGQLKEKPNE